MCPSIFNPKRTIVRYKLSPYLLRKTQIRDRFKFFRAQRQQFRSSSDSGGGGGGIVVISNEQFFNILSIGRWSSILMNLIRFFFSFSHLSTSLFCHCVRTHLKRCDIRSIFLLHGKSNFAFVRERNLKRQKKKRLKKTARICVIFFPPLEESIVMRKTEFQRALDEPQQISISSYLSDVFLNAFLW